MTASFSGDSVPGRVQGRTRGLSFSLFVGSCSRGLNGLRRVCLVGALACCQLVLGTLPAYADPALDLLTQMSEAAHQLTYTGVYVFQHEGDMKSSRVFHTNDNGSERTRIDALDGPSRQILRVDDDLRCYFPDAHVIRTEHTRHPRLFPALIEPPVADYRDHYDIALAGHERVAGRTCQVITLRPKDGLRFGHELCADEQTHLLLRASTLGPHGDAVKLSAFTEIQMGRHLDAEAFKPLFPGTASWRTQRVPLLEDPDQSGWQVNSLPPGFHKIREIQRHAGRMVQLLYSDGLSTVSVFVEPVEGNGRPEQGAFLPGALSYYSVRSADHQVTVVGEVPMTAATQIGQSVINLRSIHP